MGQGDLDCFFLNPEIDCVAICDVDDARIAKGVQICEKKRGKKPDTVKDFRRVLDRKDVDVVLIATPDHWHALPTVMACQAGKDVYVEKPLAKTIDEGRAMLEASRRHNRVVQRGPSGVAVLISSKPASSSARGSWAKSAWSGPGPTWIGCPPWASRPIARHRPESTMTNGWAAAPKRPFNPNRFHFNFRWFWDYAGGLMTDWGVHLINMALMGMGPEPPRSVSSSGGKFVFDDNSETPDSQVTTYEFPNYMLVWEHMAGLNNGLNNRSWGIEWSGSEGTIILNDEGWEIRPERKPANLDMVKKPGSGNPRPAHVRNFLDCVKSRQQPVLNLEKGHHVSTVAHLGNIAFRTGRKLVWDPTHEKIVGDREADKLVGVSYRKPWNLPYSRRA